MPTAFLLQLGGYPHVTKTWEPRPLGLHIPVRNPVGGHDHWSSLKVFLKCAISRSGFPVNRLLFCAAWNVSCHGYLLVRVRIRDVSVCLSVSSFLLTTLTRLWLTAVPVAVIVLISPIGNESLLKIIINDTIIFFLNCNQHFGNFKP